MGLEGSTDSNAGEAGSVNYHREVYHWWESNTVGGETMDMIESEGGRGTNLLSTLSLDSSRHLLILLCESGMNKQFHSCLAIKKLSYVVMNSSIFIR